MGGGGQCIASEENEEEDVRVEERVLRAKMRDRSSDQIPQIPKEETRNVLKAREIFNSVHADSLTLLDETVIENK